MAVVLLGRAGITLAQGPPIKTQTAFVVGLEGAGVRSFLKLTRKSGLLLNGEAIPDPLDRKVTAIAVPVMVPYEVLPNRLVVVAGIPYLDKELSRLEGEARQVLENSGLGDASLRARYQILQKDRRGETARLSLLGGIKLPTGSDDRRDDRGTPLPPSLQLGSGSVDFSTGAVFTWVRGPFGFNLDGILGLNTAANGRRRGNALAYDIALGLRVAPWVYEIYFTPSLNLYLEFNGVVSGRDESGGHPMTNSGGHILFVSPGVQYIPWRTFLVEGSLQLPVVQDLNGSQLATDFALSLGFRWLLWD